jgi:hypothetical protein
MYCEEYFTNIVWGSMGILGGEVSKVSVECLEVPDVASRSIWKESRDTWRESILHLEFWSGVAERSDWCSCSRKKLLAGV